MRRRRTTISAGGLLILLVALAAAHWLGTGTNQTKQNLPQPTPVASGVARTATEPSVTADRQTRIQEYFRKANEGLAETPLPAVMPKRDVSSALKAQIRRRDGYQCVICGSTTKLEVDHMVALMNGGRNDASNLATLCDECHTIKTRMDTSLRRHREKLRR